MLPRSTEIQPYVAQIRPPQNTHTPPLPPLSLPRKRSKTPGVWGVPILYLVKLTTFFFCKIQHFCEFYQVFQQVLSSPRKVPPRNRPRSKDRCARLVRPTPKANYVWFSMIPNEYNTTTWFLNGPSLGNDGLESGRDLWNCIRSSERWPRLRPRKELGFRERWQTQVAGYNLGNHVTWFP